MKIRVHNSDIGISESELVVKRPVNLPNGTMVVSQTLQRWYHDRHGVNVLCVPNGGVLRGRREPRTILE